PFPPISFSLSDTPLQLPLILFHQYSNQFQSTFSYNFLFYPPQYDTTPPSCRHFPLC
ncbi:unnamed protein product, partial [Staurois parvus]